MEKLLPEGFKLFMAGQAFVLSFIGCIVLSMKLIAWWVGRSQKPAIGKEAHVAIPVPEGEAEDELLAAVMVAAIHKSRIGGDDRAS